MNYSDALRQAIHRLHSGDAPKWDFSTWDYQTQLACSAEETEAIQQYGVAIQRQAYEIVCELQDSETPPGQAEHKQRHEQNGKEHRFEKGVCPTI